MSKLVDGLLMACVRGSGSRAGDNALRDGHGEEAGDERCLGGVVRANRGAGASDDPDRDAGRAQALRGALPQTRLVTGCGLSVFERCNERTPEPPKPLVIWLRTTTELSTLCLIW